jgi:hypothetical protein
VRGAFCLFSLRCGDAFFQMPLDSWIWPRKAITSPHVHFESDQCVINVCAPIDCTSRQVFNLLLQDIYFVYGLGFLCHSHASLSATESSRQLLILWWAVVDSNHGPQLYQSCALTD